MSVIVEHLTKIYGSQKALDDISFEAPKGKITGFLGPNGAGKSTTMKIATGYLSATSGGIQVEGVDVAAQALEVKQITGYLPEHNPLYLEMYVKEYLSFVAAAYQLSQRSSKVQGMIEKCGLQKEQNKKIGALSKGYRQRVGLAQALIHDPQVLILDEPTSGLDPNQLVEIRKVIREASVDKTVILSSHIMQEVEALCDKVVIINNGKIVADDSVTAIRSSVSEMKTYHVIFEQAINVGLFEKEEITVEVLENNHYRFSSKEDCRKQIMKIVAESELSLLSINAEEASLEGVFHQLTAER